MSASDLPMEPLPIGPVASHVPGGFEFRFRAFTLWGVVGYAILHGSGLNN